MTTAHPPQPRYVDGNALAGPLAEIFAADLTPALRRCAHCHTVSAVAELHVYTHCPGLVARCPGCETLVLRLVRTDHTIWLDLGATGCIQLDLT
ncbi:DUF6510 family protein [Salinactinospora qingdaonensis]|uniref:Uncharacterized protein n=1 Tax=Salinactinospora qingdaonensis TaxID=702744 RepID=A0ABP7G3M1_9ACTN